MTQMWELVVLGLYFIPSIVAVVRHQRAAPVIVINVLLGWTVVGWICALILSVWPAQKMMTLAAYERTERIRASEEFARAPRETTGRSTVVSGPQEDTIR
jgi:hypothetical protein